MERDQTLKQGDVVGPMERSGAVLRMHILVPSIVSGTCTMAATVPESLWNHKLRILRQPWHPFLPPVTIPVGVVLRTSRIS